MARTKREIGGRGERQSREGEKNEFVIEEGNRTPIFQRNPVVATGTDVISLGLGRATNEPLVRVARDIVRPKEREGGGKVGGRAKVSERR